MHDAVESLKEAFKNFSLKETSVGNFILNECNLTVKRTTLQPLARNSPDNLEKRHSWIKKWAETTDMNYLQNPGVSFVGREIIIINNERNNRTRTHNREPLYICSNEQLSLSQLNFSCQY